jgi:hypothetical protein
MMRAYARLEDLYVGGESLPARHLSRRLRRVMKSKLKSLFVTTPFSLKISLMTGV